MTDRTGTMFDDPGRDSPDASPRSLPVVRKGLTPDPLGYDTSDLLACARAMAEDALSGRCDDAIEAEIQAVRGRLGDHR